MKPWIIRTSLALNVLVLALCAGVWLGRDQIIQTVLERLADARISFFDSFPGAQGDVVMLGDSITHGGEWSVSYRQYRQIVTRIQAGSPSTRIYLQSLLPREAAMREEVEAYNRQVRAIADELGVAYIDLYPAFLALDGSIRDELTLDELHFSGAGYRVWQSRLEPVMRKAGLHSGIAK